MFLNMKKQYIYAEYFIVTLCVIMTVYAYLTYFKRTSPNENLISWLDSPVTIIDPVSLEQYNQYELRLINYLKVRHLTPPSKLPYEFNGTFCKTPADEPSITDAVRKIFKSSAQGFFVECGAFDGIYSNTLFLEREFGWSGLLIECNPILVPELRKVHRKAFIADVCLSQTEHPSNINLTSMDNWPASSSAGSGDIFPHHISSNFTRFEVPAFPLYSIIAATGVSTVDFVTLDVQSIEWNVIRHFPFDLIFVKVWVIEVSLLNAEDENSLKSLMLGKEYKEIPLTGGGNALFAHNSVIMM